MIRSRLHSDAASRRRGLFLFAVILVAFWAGWATVNAAGLDVYHRVTAAIKSGIEDGSLDKT